MNKKGLILNFLESRYGKHIDSSRMKNQEVFELLIETVLSQRTRDENSEKAARQLFSVAQSAVKIYDENGAMLFPNISKKRDMGMLIIIPDRKKKNCSLESGL